MGFFYIYYVEGLCIGVSKGSPQSTGRLVWNNLVAIRLSFQMRAFCSEVNYLKVIIDPDKKLFTVWLTNEEKADDKFLEDLREEAKLFKKAGYLAAFFFSGKEELIETTSALVCSNYRELCDKRRKLGVATEV